MAIRINELPELGLLRGLFELTDGGSGLRWGVSKGTGKAGRIAGNILTNPRTKKQYWMVGLNGKTYLAHRIVYALATGQLPSVNLQVDHRDGNGLNNCPTNLRLANHAQNSRNLQGARRGSKSGTRGVYQHKQGGWVARITVNGRDIHLGYYPTKFLAIIARLAGEVLHLRQPLSRFPFVGNWCMRFQGTLIEGRT